MRVFVNTWVLIKLFIGFLIYVLFPPRSKYYCWAEMQLIYFAFGEGPQEIADYFNIALLIALLIGLFQLLHY